MKLMVILLVAAFVVSEEILAVETSEETLAVETEECNKRAREIALQTVEDRSRESIDVEIDPEVSSTGPFATSSFHEPYIVYKFSGQVLNKSEVRRFVISFGVDPYHGCEIHPAPRLGVRIDWEEGD